MSSHIFSAALSLSLSLSLCQLHSTLRSQCVALEALATLNERAAVDKRPNNIFRHIIAGSLRSAGLLGAF